MRRCARRKDGINMTEERIRKLKTVYGICLSALTIAVGVLFIMQTWSIFFSAENSPYTTEIIAEKFLQILAPVCLWGAAAIGGGVLSACFPDEQKRIKGQVDFRATLFRLKGSLPQNEGGMAALNKESRFRKIVWSVCAALCLIFAAVILAILFYDPYQPWFDMAFFTEHGAAADRLVRLSPWLASGMLVCFLAIFLDAYSVQRETALVKAKIAENAKQGIKPVKTDLKKPRTLWETLCKNFPVLRSKWWKLGLQTTLCLLGVVLFIVGIFNGGMTDVFEKARNICTQCIGLG